jgi:hypothetical protein
MPGHPPPPRVLDSVKSAAMPSSADLDRNVLEPDAARALVLERLIDGHRAVDEPKLGRDDRYVDAISCEGT